MQTARSNNIPFWLLLIGLFLILVSKSLLTEGMFLDGVTYASISRNMADGQGTFWDPHYTQTLYPEFCQHPPLALGMEALAFKAFGDHWWVEKFYSVLMFLLSGLFIALIWKRTTNNLRWAWLPLLFWLAMPLVSWSATNNLLENTMSVQGPIDSLILLVSIAAFVGIMFLVCPGSFAYLKDYIRLQVIGGGLHEVTASSRFYIVFALLQQLVIPCALALVLVICKTKSKVNSKIFEFPPDKAWFYVFLIMGLVGVLPIMVSVKQRDFYMLAALPFFALACGHITLSMLTLWLPKITPKVRGWMTLGAACVVLLGLVLNVFHIGKYGRDEALIEEVKQKITESEGNNVIEISQEEYTQWAKHAYFMRYGKISLNPTENPLPIDSRQPTSPRWNDMGDPTEQLNN